MPAPFAAHPTVDALLGHIDELEAQLAASEQARADLQETLTTVEGAGTWATANDSAGGSTGTVRSTGRDARMRRMIMRKQSLIDWTDTTWEVTAGCTKISEGCRNCYAARMVATRLKHHRDTKGLAEHTDTGYDWTGDIRLLLHNLEKPLHWRTPRRIFVNSRSDLFHQNVPRSFVSEIFRVVRECPQHTFIVLTKRIGSAADCIRAYCAGHNLVATLPDPRALEDRAARIWPLPNLWLLVSASTQAEVDRVTPILLEIPAAVRGLSLEPLLEEVDLSRWLPPFTDCDHYNGGCTRAENVFAETSDPASRPGLMSCSTDKCVFGRRGLDWIIAGCESGPHRRPAELQWFRDLRDQCQEAGVPYFLKQAEREGVIVHSPTLDGVEWRQEPVEVPR